MSGSLSFSQRHPLNAFGSLAYTFLKVDDNASNYHRGALVQPGRADAHADSRKSREYKSKIDIMITKLITGAGELRGLWSQELVSLFEKGIRLVRVRDAIQTPALQHDGSAV